jgi:hypothetical protein
MRRNDVAKKWAKLKREKGTDNLRPYGSDQSGKEICIFAVSCLVGGEDKIYINFCFLCPNVDLLLPRRVNQKRNSVLYSTVQEHQCCPVK